MGGSWTATTCAHADGRRAQPRRLRVRRMLATGVVLACALAGLPALPQLAAAQTAGAVVDLAGCRANTLPANDDGSTGLIALPFTLNFYGIGYEHAYVNNNGNLTFDEPLWTYTPFPLRSTNRAIVAPFFADVDTRGSASGLVTYGAVTFEGQRAFCVNWIDVGYYNQRTDKLNSFQLLLVERPETGNTDFDIVYNYDEVQWETGDASGGSGGLGGASARVGFSSGEGTEDTSYELPGSGVNGAFLDGNPETGLVRNSRASDTPGRYRFAIRNGSPNYILRPPAELFGHRPGSLYVADPVHTATGNFVHTTVDLAPPAHLPGLSWARTYNSRDTGDGALGTGWATTLSMALREREGGALELREHDGRVVTFLPDGDGYDRPQDFPGRLARAGDGHEISLFAGERWRFDAAGRLSGLTQADGHEITVSHDDGGRLVAASSSTGHGLAFAYGDGGRLTGVTASDGRAVTYGYDGLGRLAWVEAADGARTVLESDDAGRVAAITDPTGTLLVRNTYDGAGRVVTQEMADGRRVHLDYLDLDGVTIVTHEATGEETRYEHDTEGRPTAVVDGLGGTERRSYDSAGNLAEVVDRRGSVTSWTYDDDGRVTGVTAPDGATRAFTYDDLGRLTSETDAAGGTTTYRYAGADRTPNEVEAADGGTTSYAVSDGVVTSVTDPDGVRVEFTYDAARNLVAAADAAGGVTRFDFDDAGRRIRHVTPMDRTTVYDHDPAGRLVRRVDPDGAEWTWTFDAAGRVTAETDPTGAVTGYDYDAAGRLATQTDPNGATTRFRYDAAGHLAEVEAADGSVTTSEHGGLSRLLATPDAAGAQTRHDYDAAGNLVATTDATGATSRLEYDAAGRVVREIDPLGAETTYTYDVRGLLSSSTDPDGAVTSYAHDAVGRLVAVTDVLGGQERWGYTPAGRLASATDARGNTTTYAYDAAGRLAGVTDPLGGEGSIGYDLDGQLVSMTTPGGRTLSFAYDAAGRLAARTDPSGATVRRTFTPRGELESVIDATGGVAHFAYDPTGNLIEATDANGGVTRYGYDDVGNLVRRTDALGGETSWAHDPVGRIVASTDPLGRLTQLAYDPLGRVTELVDPTGRIETIDYDAAGRPLTRAFDDDAVVAYTYDAAGRRTTMTDATGQTGYTYDPLGRLVEVTRPGGALTATYDADGNRTAVSYPGGRTVTYRYDALSHLVGVEDPDIGATAFELDADGRLLAEHLPGDQSRRYTLDADGLVVGFSQDVGGDRRDTTLTRDAAGRVIEEVDGERRLRYRYDAAGQLTDVETVGDGGATWPVDNRDDTKHNTQDNRDGTKHNTQSNRDKDKHGSGETSRHLSRFAYDAAGNRVGVAYGDADGSATFDAAHQILTQTLGEEHTEFTHDAAGRLVEIRVGDAVTTTELDARGLPARTERVVDGVTDRVEERAYDGDGLLRGVAVTDADGTRRQVDLTWDVTAAIPQLVALQDGADATDIVRGHGPLAVAGGLATGVLATDVRGSIVPTADTAPVVAALEYDAFGQPVDPQPGDAPVLLGYRGETHVGDRLHLRARDYLPEAGRFTSPDPLPGVAGSVTAANPFPYADNDPVNQIDPLGLRPLSDGAFGEGWPILGAVGAGFDWAAYFERHNARHRAAVRATAALVRQTVFGAVFEETYAIAGAGPNGGTGIADVVLSRADGTLSVWEIKPDTPYGHATGAPQLNRYLTALRSQGHAAFAGFWLAPRTTTVPLTRETILVTSGLVLEQGVEFYRDAPRPRPRPQPQPAPAPQPVPVTAPGGIGAREVAIGAGAVGAGYLIYRGLRLLPSLAPPLWPTLPANLAIP